MYKKLATIQQMLNAPKNRRNTFGNYNYRSCEDILEAVKPLLGDLVLTISDDIVVMGLVGYERFYVKATATLQDDNGAKISVTAYAREQLDKKGMDDAQITGACSSYARKYALNGLFLIDDSQDADTQDNRVEKPVVYTQVQSQKAPQATVKQVGAIENLLANRAEVKQLILEDYGISDLNELDIAQASTVISKLNKGNA